MAWVKGGRLYVNLIHVIEVEDRSDAQTGPLVQVLTVAGRYQRYAGAAAEAILRHVDIAARLTTEEDRETLQWWEDVETYERQAAATTEPAEVRQPRPIR